MRIFKVKATEVIIKKKIYKANLIFAKIETYLVFFNKSSISSNIILNYNYYN